MSALARYFNTLGKTVGGYDRVSTSFTDKLVREGITIHFSDDPSLVSHEFLDIQSTLVIYTPAVPKTHNELLFFRGKGFRVMKRSEVLGELFQNKYGIAIAGTHGKTTVSTMLAEVLNHSLKGCNAFLGGISKNLESNLLLNNHSDLLVVEADEYDRSFLKLFPKVALVSSADADHLDIYGSYSDLKIAFEEFLKQVDSSGSIVIKKGLNLTMPEKVKSYTYHLDNPEADFYAANIRREGFNHTFNFITPGKVYKDLKLGVYGKINLENMVAALSVAYVLDTEESAMRKGSAEFRGVNRRFDVKVESADHLYIDDYAHHPEEIKAFLNSIREALPGKELTGIFQPHLYSRTRDFAPGFAESLSILDHVILLSIYPAREEPIPGVDSKLIFDKLTNKGDKIICEKEQVFQIIEERKPGALVTMGAGDIDQLVDGIAERLIK